MGIAGAAVGLVNPVAGAALGVASYIISMIVAATPAVDVPPFYGKWADVQARFATAVSQAQKALEVQSAEVRQSWGLSQLLAQVAGPAGPWHTPDAVGLKGSMEESLALWAYKTLLPTMYDRYELSNCQPQNGNVFCHSATFAGQVGAPPDFTTLGPPPSGSWNDGGIHGDGGTPCFYEESFGWTECNYSSQPAASIADQVWGPLSDNCNYNGTPETAWTFGNCNLGVSPQDSVDFVGGTANGWQFTTCYGNPVVSAPNWIPHWSVPDPQGHCDQPSGTAAVGSGGGMQLTAPTRLPSRFKVRRATLFPKRLLYEPRGAGALLSRPRAARPPRHTSRPRLGRVSAPSTSRWPRAQCPAAGPCRGAPRPTGRRRR